MWVQIAGVEMSGLNLSIINWRMPIYSTLNAIGPESNVFFIIIISIRPKALGGPQGGWKFPFSFTIHKWGFPCYISRGRYNTHRKHTLFMIQFVVHGDLLKCKNVSWVCFPLLCGKLQTPDIILIKDEEDGGGMPAVGTYWKNSSKSTVTSSTSIKYSFQNLLRLLVTFLLVIFNDSPIIHFQLQVGSKVSNQGFDQVYILS